MATEMTGETGSACAQTSSEFAAWVRPHLTVLRALAGREVDTAADDVVQEALTRAWRRRETYRNDRGTPRAWLIAILLDKSRRHRSRTRTFPPQLGPTPSADPTAATTQRLEVDAALATLPQRQRQVITLFYLADLSVNEVAEVLHISPGTVKSTLSDARTALRNQLEDTSDERH